MAHRLAEIRREKKISERDMAQRLGIARETLRRAEQRPEHSTVRDIRRLAEELDQSLDVLVTPNRRPPVEDSTVAVSIYVCRDGFASWKIHVMNLVDAFRRHRDIRLVLLPPVSQLDPKCFALLASVTAALCQEANFTPPDWARDEYFLAEPWFVSGIENLKALAILESAPAFRRNNIFVLKDFLARA